MFCLQGTSLRGCQREALIEVLTAPEQAAPEQAPYEQPPPLLTTDEAMNQAFGTSSEEEEDEEDEVEEVGEEEADGGQQDNYSFLFLVNFYSQFD
jgi:hypothetical protein